MRELKSIYDLLDVSYMVLSLNGAASFSRARRYDGKMIYFKEKGDMTMAIGMVDLMQGSSWTCWHILAI